MNIAIEKTISLFLLILVGFLLRKKVTSKEQRSGIKSVILSIALPAMIFIGLQKIQFSLEMLALPVIVLVFNMLLFYLTDFLGSTFKDAADKRTLKMLIPSLAPGLSCFPFLLEYFGEEALANAAIADIGNKIFVLAILYVIGFRWYYVLNQSAEGGTQQQYKALLKSLIAEPVNLVIMVAIVMLCFGINYEVFPPFLKLTIDRISLIMTPLVMIFIGLSVKLHWDQIKAIIFVLISRSAVAFLISAALIWTLQISDPVMRMFIVLFPQSSCSFWPFAHMSVVNQKASGTSVFNLSLGLNILAVSLPFSITMILSLATYGEAVSEPALLTLLAAAMLVVVCLPALIRLFASQLAPRLKSWHQLTTKQNIISKKPSSQNLNE